MIITLWLVTILAVLVVAIARHLSLDLRLTKYRLALDQAKTLARSGIYLGMQRLEQDGHDKEPGGKEYDWLGDDWATFGSQGDPNDRSVWVVRLPVTGESAQLADQVDQVEIKIVDEDRKLDVNAATSAELNQLIDSIDVAQAIVDYYDPDHNGPWELPVERPPYEPKNAPVVTLAELWDIPDQTEELFARLGQFTFAVPGSSPINKVNINTAPREVLVAVGLPTLAEEILQFRAQGHYFTDLSEPVKTENPAAGPPPFASLPEFRDANNRLKVISSLFAIQATGRVHQPEVRAHVEAIVQRTGDKVDLLAWREG